VQTELPSQTASATPLSAEEKQRRKENRKRFLDGIRARLASVVHQLTFSPAEAGIVCGKSPTWAYRKIYSGEFRVISSDDGRISIPRSEIEHYAAGTEKYNPKPKHAKNGGGQNSLGSL
jgi:hypothetical protein